MFIVFAYIKFLLRSTNQHGVHSPFVYGLVTRCFYDRKKYAAYALLKKHRNSLQKNTRTIHITDFGAGSRVFKTSAREVSKMAKNTGISPKRARLLNRLVRYLKADTALELGTSLGLGTAAMAAGNKVKIITIEGCAETAAIAKEKFEEFGLNNIQLKIGRFEENPVVRGQWTEERPKHQAPNPNASHTKYPQTVGADPQSVIHQPTTEIRQLSTQQQPQTTNHKQQTSNSELRTPNYDLIYIDGNHQKEATLSYFKKLLPTVHNDSVMIFDDIHWSKGMEEAWEEIKAHPKVKVSIDTFQWGLVFFRREQEKEHFVIRV
ncbi:class I SAM-dependent methyltransferase [Salinimicrobium tongyeongense]|uniref:Class I SAM-dependent methyltransferase n=1 Tax=Salinimicrobium tongyeongense TaxID=2809707 RepID=A0ABY6NPX0_9FLAO|nr:class I SAM-dependent methyltransferase [Salinimicrobium tongyeongense]